MNRFTATFYAIGLGLFLTSGTVAAAPLNYEDYPIIKLRSLDKITARTMNFEAKVGSTIRFGDIFIKVQACRKPPPIEKNEAAAFLQIYQADESSPNDAAPTDDGKGENKSSWIFSGWMFASSPALSAMDHPIYDVWVLDCIGRDPEPLPPPEQQAAEAEKAKNKGDSTNSADANAQPNNAAPSTETSPKTDASSPVPSDTDNTNTSPSPTATPDANTNEPDATDDTAPNDAAPQPKSEPSLDDMLQPKKAVTSSSDPAPARRPEPTPDENQTPPSQTEPQNETPLTGPDPQPAPAPASAPSSPSNLDGIY